MLVRPFGNTGLTTSALGLGAGQLGDHTLDDAAVGRLLHAAIDLGITLIDTARSYGLSEERIGRHLSAHRQRILLSTKLGYGVDGVSDWCAEAVTRGIDEALCTLQTDWLDIVHLHSCDREVLQQAEVVDALERAVAAGKVRVAAYSGENHPLQFALASGRFAGLQCSVSLWDQGAIQRVTKPAADAGIGVIAKRPMANAPWRFTERPTGHEADKYWHRFQALAHTAQELSWPEFAVRYAAYAPGVSCAITGTANLAHLRANVEAIARGPLPAAQLAEVTGAWQRCGAEWPGII